MLLLVWHRAVFAYEVECEAYQTLAELKKDAVNEAFTVDSAAAGIANKNFL